MLPFQGTTEILDLHTGQWKLLAPSPPDEAVYMAGAVTYNGKVVVYGGEHESGEVSTA